MQPQPLLLALDHETGIGYGASPHESGALSLLQQLVADETPTQSRVVDRLDGLRLAKLTAFLETGQLEQAITELELTEAACTAPTNPLARSWAVLGELHGSNASEIDAGHYQFLVKSVSGPSGAALMARFGESHPGLGEQMTRLTDWEADQYPDAILSELVHLPAGRVGNVLHRPTLRAYEIPYITPASVDEHHTLLLADLWVHVVNGTTIELWSKNHNRRVLPRNTTAAADRRTQLPRLR